MDKFRTTYAISVSFAEGEQPTNRKLNAISSQSKAGLAVVEKALGDLWNQSADPIASDYPNRIANLARIIGDQDLLGGRIPLPDFTGTTSVRIKQNLPTTERGLSEYAFDYLPQDDSTLSASVAALKNVDGNNYDSSDQATASDVTTNTRWFIEDTSNYKLKLGSSLNTSQSVTYVEYNVLAEDFPSDFSEPSAFNYLPPSQTSWNGIKISQISANKYFLVLPFRYRVSGVSLNDTDKIPNFSINQASIAEPAVKRYWGPSTSGYSYTSGISDSVFYRHSFPAIVRDMFVSPVAGQTIPAGLIYLWDTTAETIVEGVTFKIPESPMALFGGQKSFVIQAEGATLDRIFNGLTSSDSTEAAADYQSEFRFITAGVSLVQAIQDLRNLVLGSFSSTTYFPQVGAKPRIIHGDLIKTQPVVGTRHSLELPPAFTDGDDHSYLLSRLGSTGSATTRRDRYDNAMLGDLLLASIDSSNNYQNIADVSNSIWFSAVTSGINLYSEPASLSFYNFLDGSASTFNVANGPLVLGTRSLYFGDTGGIFVDENMPFRHFSDDKTTASSAISTGTLYLIGDTTEADSLNEEAVNLGIKIYSSITNNDNKIEWKGNDLKFDSPDNEDVVIGEDSSTDLRLVNNILKFGTSQVDYLHFSDVDNKFTFFENNFAANSVVVAGKLQAYDHEIELDPAGIFDLLLSSGSNLIETRKDGFTLDTVFSTGEIKLRSTATTGITSNTLHRHNIPKAWGYIPISAGSLGVSTTFNVSNITIGGSGAYVEITLDNGFSSGSNYCVVSSIELNTAGATTHVRTSKTGTVFQITASLNDSTNIDLDDVGTTLNINFIVFGLQT